MIAKRILFLLLAFGLVACTGTPPKVVLTPTPTSPPTVSCSSLLDAVKQSDGDAVNACIQQGADVNQTDSGGLSILNYAAFYGDAEIVAQLLDAGADVVYQDPWGMSSLHAALKEGHDAVAQLLIARGADVNAKTTAGNYVGFTPLHTAVYFKKAGIEVIAQLLQAGADANATNNAGKTALQLATANDAQDVVALLGKYSVAATPTPEAPQVEGRLVFYSMSDGDAEIHTIHADGSDERQLTDNDVNDFGPAWSPDGQWIAFMSDREDPHPVTCFPECLWRLYIMDADGNQLRKVLDWPGSQQLPAWSPDGAQLAFESDSDGDGKGEIYVVNVDGTNVQPLTDDEADDRNPDWSPDGKRIAFTSTRDGTADIYIMDSDGSHQRRLFDSGLQDLRPTWSPDGAQIAFFSMNWPAVRQDIYVMDADGAHVRQLTHTPRIADENPQWSPDGLFLVYQTDQERDFDIYIMNADGSAPQPVTRNRTPDYWPDWQPQQ